MNSLFFLVRPFSFVSYCLIVVFFMLGCSEQKEQKFNCKQEYLQDCVIVRIKRIRTEIQISLDRRELAFAGVSMRAMGYKLDGAKLRTVKAAEQFIFEDAQGKKHRLSEFAEIKLGIVVTYEEPWGTNPFNI
ncbi:MAG: hypothetical protein ACO1N0_13255 [Fluviicola sp.]